jgi:hypothetical protein
MNRGIKSILGMMLVFLAASAAAAQDDAVAVIQKRYSEVRARIELALKAEKEGVGAGLYATELVTNSHNAPWRAVGNYRKVITFWYTDQPDFAVNDNLPPEGVLIKIDVRIEASVRRENEEYLFDKGKVVFYFHRVQYGDEPAQETRFYFRDGKVVRALSGTKILENGPAASAALRAAETLIKIFLDSF